MLIFKLAESHYNLRSKGKMTITNEVNPTANLSITNENPESSRERINLNDEEEIALLKLQLDELRGELR